MYSILSRTAVAGQQVVPDDQGELDFTETGPVWYLATLDQETFHVHDFDDTLSQWVRSGVTHARAQCALSVFSQVDIIGMAMNDQQFNDTEDIAAIAVSRRLVIARGVPPALVLVRVVSFYPELRARLEDNTEIAFERRQVALIDAPDVANFDAIPDPVRLPLIPWLQAYTAVHHPPAPVAAAPAPRAPKMRPMPVAPVAVLPKVNQPPPPPPGANKGPAPPMNARPKGPHVAQAQGRTSRNVMIKYTYQGQQCQADGIFIDENNVRWSDGSTSAYPLQWPGCVETELHIGQPTDQRNKGSRPPGQTETNAFMDLGEALI